MKHLSLLAVIAFFLTSCGNSNQDKAEALVKKCLQGKLNDPKSYESVSFSRVVKLKDTTTTFEGKTEPVKYNGKYEIMHTYRSKNVLGGVETKSEVFQIDSAFTQADCCYVAQNDLSH